MNTKLLLGVSALAALASCAGVPTPDGPPIATAADRHQIRVEQTGDRLDVAVASDELMLPVTDQAQIADFAARYLRVGHGPLIMSIPSGGANADAAARIAHETRMRLVESGVPYAAISGAAYDGSQANGAPVVLSFTRFEAFAPECAPLWTQDLAHQSNNQPYESFGCSAQANLAAMIDDPHDLIEPRDEQARDGGRRAVVLDHYRRGEPTAATRTNDERVTISNAVQ